MHKKHTYKSSNDHIYLYILQLMREKQVIADSSSLIYFEKLGLLPFLSQYIGILTIQEVIEEIGSEHLSNSRYVILPPPPHDPSYASLITDRKLVAQAQLCKLPVLSDDRRINRAGFELGFTVYPAIKLLLWLYFNNFITQERYLEARNQLADFARYAPKLLAETDELLFMFGKYF